jgi:hypothetical protein
MQRRNKTRGQAPYSARLTFGSISTSFERDDRIEQMRHFNRDAPYWHESSGSCP